MVALCRYVSPGDDLDGLTAHLETLDVDKVNNPHSS